MKLEGYLMKEKSKLSRLHGLTGDINKRYFRIRSIEVCAGRKSSKIYEEKSLRGPRPNHEPEDGVARFEGSPSPLYFWFKSNISIDVSRFAVTDILGERGARVVLLQEHDGSRGPWLDLPQGRDRDRRTSRHDHPYIGGPDTTPVCTHKG